MPSGGRRPAALVRRRVGRPVAATPGDGGAAPLPVVIACAFATGFSIEIFGVLWDTAVMQEIPQEKLSRISSYDALGSSGLMPVGFIVAGPVAAVVGTRATFVGAAVLTIVATALVFLSHEVRTLERKIAVV